VGRHKGSRRSDVCPQSRSFTGVVRTTTRRTPVPRQRRSSLHGRPDGAAHRSSGRFWPVIGMPRLRGPQCSTPARRPKTNDPPQGGMACGESNRGRRASSGCRWATGQKAGGAIGVDLKPKLFETRPYSPRRQAGGPRRLRDHQSTSEQSSHRAYRGYLKGGASPRPVQALRQ